MTRYRPPSQPKAPYITPEGAKKLTGELQHLWKVERPEVTAAVHEAAKNGDRSENGDYIYGKRRLREIDRRVRYLSKRLDELNIVDRIPADQGKIYFGAWVCLKKLDSLEEPDSLEKNEPEQLTVRLVGPDEIEPARGYISIDSPLARQLVGKSVNDEVEVFSGEVTNHYRVIEISYDPV